MATTAKIGITETDFDTTVDGLVSLASAGVAKSVIEAMTNAAIGPTASEAAAAGDCTELSSGSSSSFEGSPCETPGILVEQDGTLGELERAAFQRGKTGGLLKMGLTHRVMSGKNVGIIRGAMSPTRIARQSPVLLFCHEMAAGGFASPGISDVLNPSDILLVSARTNPKKD